MHTPVGLDEHATASGSAIDPLAKLSLRPAALLPVYEALCLDLRGTLLQLVLGVGPRGFSAAAEVVTGAETDAAFASEHEKQDFKGKNSFRDSRSASVEDAATLRLLRVCMTRIHQHLQGFGYSLTGNRLHGGA